jgi:hypothetical protein
VQSVQPSGATASQARRVGAGMAAATVRYAMCHRHAGRDAACCSRHPPSTPAMQPAPAETLDVMRGAKKGSPRMWGPASDVPGADEGGSCMALAADAPCDAQHTMLRISPASSCAAQHAAYRVRRAQQCTVQLAGRASASGPHSVSATAQTGLRGAWVRAQACMRA